jgi:hypothetical protein
VVLDKLRRKRDDDAMLTRHQPQTP